MMNNRVAVAFIVALILCETCCQAGPARSLASVVAARAAKIPRSIRAPFRNTEMMTARGFGKRSQPYKDGNQSIHIFLIYKLLYNKPIDVSIQ